MNCVEKDIEKIIVNILTQQTHTGLQFEELRSKLEYMGVYVDGLCLRKVISEMIRKGVVCKEVLIFKNKLVMKICENLVTSSSNKH